jgi:kynurenine formamidase
LWRAYVSDTENSTQAKHKTFNQEGGTVPIVDISGPIRDGMWSYGDPYPTPRIEQIPPPDWLSYPVYSQTVHMAVQSGTYLETAAHMDPSRMTIDELPLARCYLVDGLCLWIPRSADQAIEADDLIDACKAAGVTPRPRDVLLVGTGWDRQWDAPNYVTNPPYFTSGAIDWVLAQDISLLGADTPRFDSPRNPQNFFPKFFAHDILLLAPLVHLDQVRQARGKLVALPIKIDKACASPVRALWIED